MDVRSVTLVKTLSTIVLVIKVHVFDLFSILFRLQTDIRCVEGWSDSSRFDGRVMNEMVLVITKSKTTIGHG